jgi:signal transduction histidine kinase
MFTIKAKIVFAYTLVFGVLLTAFALIIYQGALDTEVAKLDARLETHADKIQTELEEDESEAGFPRRLELDSVRTEGLADAKVRLLTADGRIVFADSGFALDTRMKWNSGDVTALQKATVKMGGRRVRVLQGPVEIRDRVSYLVQIAAPLDEIERSLGRLRLLFLILIPAGLFLAGCAAWFITAMAFKPMMKMVKTAETISAKNLDARLELPKARDEVRKLGSALNEMMQRIDSAVRSQKQFIADASHELRTPLTIIRTELESAQRTIRHPSSKQSISTALLELDQLSKMVGDLLMLARLDAAQVKFEPARLRLDELLVECVQAVGGVAKRRRVRLRLFVQEAVEASGDREKLKSVILNLLDNAIKYAGRRGMVSASLVLQPDSPGSAFIVIHDSGQGISSSEQEKIFRRFYRAPQSRSRADGSGLGLAIARRFVEMHKGWISVQSEEGRGSTFTIQLPLLQVSR